MPAIITNKFRINNAEQFLESFTEASPNVYYLGIGKPQAHATQTRGDSRTENLGTDTSPLTPEDSVANEFYTFDDALAAKKITSSDISQVIPRRDWTTGTVYDYYRHDYGAFVTGTTTTQTANSGASSLFDATYYVVSSAFNGYKVLDYNGDGILSSTDFNNLISQIKILKIANMNTLIIIHRNKKSIDKISKFLNVLDEKNYGLSKILFSKLI